MAVIVSPGTIVMLYSCHASTVGRPECECVGIGTNIEADDHETALQKFRVHLSQLASKPGWGVAQEMTITNVEPLKEAIARIDERLAQERAVRDRVMCG